MTYEQLEKIAELPIKVYMGKEINEKPDYAEIDFFALQNYEDINDFNTLIDELKDQELINYEIVYYSVSIAYLAYHDPSLIGSLRLAEGFGYELKNINSEVLASIHLEEAMEDELYKHEREIDEILEGGKE